MEIIPEPQNGFHAQNGNVILQDAGRTPPICIQAPPPHGYQLPTIDRDQTSNGGISLLDASLLSRMDLPKFSGFIMDFPEFWERYYALVHSKITIDPASKFSLLKSCLSGDALHTVSCLPVTSANYDVAVNILYTKYYNVSAIRHALYSQLAALNSVDSEGKPLYNLYLQMQKLVSQYSYLQNSGIETEFGLGAVLFNKLPKATKSKIYDRNISQQNLSPVELLKILHSIVQKEFILNSMDPDYSVEKSNAFTVNTQGYRPKNYGNHGRSNSHLQRGERDTGYRGMAQQNNNQEQRFRNGNGTPNRSPNSNDVRNGNRSNRPCVFCKEDHEFWKCPLDVHQRINSVKSQKLCLTCFKPDHRSYDCQKPPCQCCNKKHNTQVCYRKASQLSGQSQTRNQGWNGRNTGGNGGNTNTRMDRRQARTTGRTYYVNAVEGENRNDTSEEHIEGHTHVVNVSRVSKPQEDDLAEEDTNSTTGTIKEEIAMMCTELLVCDGKDPTKVHKILAFFDNGSDRSYILQKTAEKLNLDPKNEERLMLNTFAQTEPVVQTSTSHDLSLILKDSTLFNMRVRSMPIMAKDLPCISMSDFTEEDNEEGNHVPRITKKTPDILIGNDFFWELVLGPQFFSQRLSEGGYLLNTRIGELTTGKFLRLPASRDGKEGTVMFSEYNYDHLSEMVQKFWNIESIGITDSPTTKDDDLCLDFFFKTIRFDKEESRYYAKWPFRDSKENLPTNYDLCMARLKNTWNQLSTNEQNMQKYQKILTEQLQNGIIEEVLEDNQSVLKTNDGVKVHYLPHHAVITEQKKTTKVRMVFAGNAKKKGFQSLNEILHKGPVILPNLLGILLRIRTAPILLSSDIEKAFHQVGLEEEDRDFVRFLWLKDNKKPPTGNNVAVFRFRRVPFGVISSPFILAATIHYHLLNSSVEVADAILKNMYVDNAFISAKTPEEAKKMYDLAKGLFAEAKMNLREWNSNSEEVNNYMSEKEKEKQDEEQSVLGLKWNVQADTIKIVVPQFTEKIWTKRQVLKTVASVFDPYGFLSAAVVQLKIFLQSLWKEELSWDTPLPKNLQEDWTEMMDGWKSMQHVTFSRRLKCAGENMTVHIFTDASKDAYGICAYLQGPEEPQLLLTKTRLSPMKQEVTIPRLELMAIELGAKMAEFINKELDLPITRTIIWSDSKVALIWTKCQKTLPVFIKNRVRTIREKAPTAVLRHVRSEDNPADLASRGISINELMTKEIWWRGPQFLQEAEERWPPDISEMETTELEAVANASIQKELIPTENMEDYRPIKVIDASRFSNWNKMLNAVMIVLLFVKLGAKKMIGKFRNTTSRRECAKDLLFHQAQSEFPPPKEVIRALRLFRCPTSTLWRCHGRLENSSLPYDAVFPIYLPKESRIAHLLILEKHRELKHATTSHVLNELRREVWIPQGRATIRKVLHQECFECRRQHAKPFKLPDFPAHPEDRITRQKSPFASCGVDYAGPLEILESGEKVWLCLFTCLTTRAIWMDIARDLSANMFLHLLRRLTAQYGRPSRIVSDNAPAFKAVARMLEESKGKLLRNSKEDELLDYCQRNDICFTFIPAFSPWSGGVYERMIGIFKTTFMRTVGRKRLTMESLRTIVKECEAVVNTRPLLYVPAEEFGSVLRPIDFLLPHCMIGAPTFDHGEDDDEDYAKAPWESLLKLWRSNTKIMDMFWNQWSTAYLTTMREHQAFSHPSPRSTTNRTPIEGEVVIVQDDALQRGQWKLAKISKVPEKKDVRHVCLQLPNKREITRPINLILPLELGPLDTTEKNKKEQQQIDNRDAGHPMITRSKKRSMNLAYLVMIIAITLLPSANGQEMKPGNTTCPSEVLQRPLFEIVHVTSCVSKGIGVREMPLNYSNIKGISHAFCWFPIDCKDGDITLTPKDGEPLCSKKCVCPKWSSTCNFYDGRERKESISSNVPESLRTYQPEGVCSFNGSKDCSEEKKIKVFNQVQLFDDNLLIVPSLTISQKDFIHADDTKCFSTKTGRPTKATSVSQKKWSYGSTYFCRQHECTMDMPMFFCVYNHPVATYSYNDTELLVKAWGTVRKEFYPNKENSTELRNDTLQTAPIARCAKGGLQVITGNQRKLEVCSEYTCLTVNNTMEGMHIPLPNGIVVFTYNVTIKSWKNGIPDQVQNLRCIPSPICEIISCWMCKEFAYNRQCWSYLDYLAIISAGFTIFWIVLMSLLFKLTSLLFKLLRFMVCIPCRIVRRIVVGTIYTIYKCCCHRRQNGNQSEFDPEAGFEQYRGRRSRTGYVRLTIALVLSILIQGTFGCSSSSSMTATQKECVNDGEKITCTLEETTVLTLQPVGQEICLSLKENTGHIVGRIRIRTKGVKYVCNKKAMYFTRDHEIRTESSHRCASAGSCKDELCETMKSDKMLDEFSAEAKKRPGYSFCKRSCGCAWCDGCGLCSPSCLFYRTFAEPTSEKSYEVFRCPVWNLQVDVSVKLQLGEEKEIEHKQRLVPGQVAALNNIQLILLGATVPQFPILSSTFVSQGQATGIVEDAPAGQLTPNSVGQLQCSTAEHAQNFQCKFSPSACSCSDSKYQVNCICPKGNVERYLQANPFPLETGSLLLTTREQIPVAITKSGSAIQLQLTMKKFQITTLKERNVCNITMGTLNGCYRCTRGAEIDVACLSTIGDETAEMTCGETTTAVGCSPTGKNSTLRLHFNDQDVHYNCSITCPGGTTDALLTGKLAYVADTPEAAFEDQGRNLFTPAEMDWSWTKGIRDFISNFNVFSHIRIIIVVAIIIGIILVFIYVRASFCLSRVYKID